MGHGDVCLLTEAESRPHSGEHRLAVIKLTESSPYPKSVKTEKSSQLASARVLAPVLCTKWSHASVWPRLTSINTDSSWLW